MPQKTVWTVLLIVLLAGCSFTQSARAPSPTTASANDTAATPKNVILLIPDGFGPASVTLARDYLRAIEGRRELAFDSLQVGAVRTAALNSRVTGSAAAGTAFATGHKTNNGIISMDTLGRPLATLLEAAEARGMATGLVATSRITHATPAVFSAHVMDRNDENEIAAQQLQHDIEVLLGGGRQHFLPEAQGGARDDGRNLLDQARDEGYRVVSDPQELEATQQTPVLGLFASGHMAYEIDREAQEEPSLAAMTAKALQLLQGDEDGFFLMVEGSRIDHAGHANDAAAHLHDILVFEEAAKVALDFAAQHEETLLVLVADHETGGMSLGRNRDGVGVYAWHPEILAAVESSHGPMIEAVLGGERRAAPAAVLRRHTGIADLTPEEGRLLEAAAAEGPEALNYALSEVIGRRALVGWTTKGHTAVDVNLYAYGPGAEQFVGNHENTYVGQTLARLLGFDLEARTEALRAGMAEAGTER